MSAKKKWRPDGVERNLNEIRDLIYKSLSLAEYTKIPILFMGNPGVAKTTNVNTWASRNGYRVRSLIGTQRVAEEILGYMVNDTGERRLITYTPDWFDEVIENEKEGFNTLLHLDELSQAPENVQGAMLQLIFERRVGGRANFLPKSCLVIASANYKGNLPSQCTIQAPTLNRFCIINVGPEDGIGMVREFLQSPEKREENLPVLVKREINDKIRESLRNTMVLQLEDLLSHFSQKDIFASMLDVDNTEFADIFDRPGPIYNFMSPRTLYYLYEMTLGLIHFGIWRKSDTRIVNSVCLGLMGLGTNNFSDKKQQDDFELALLGCYYKILCSAVEENEDSLNVKPISYKNLSVERSISKWMRANESNGNYNNDNLKNLVLKIKEEYGSDADSMYEKLTNEISYHETLGDLNKLTSLILFLKQISISEVAEYARELEVISVAWEGYKTVISHSIIN